MSLFGVAKAAGRLTIGAARAIGASVAAAKSGSEIEAAKVAESEKEKKVSSAVRLRGVTIDAFAKAPWYVLLFFSAACLACVGVIFAYETNNIRMMSESLGAGHAFKIFGYAQDLVLAVILMVLEHYFGFLLLFSKKEISFILRQGMNVLCFAIAFVIIASNFTSLQKRDLMHKRQAENQARVAELAKANQAMTAKVVAGAEKLAADAGATRTPSLMRAGAKAVTDAAAAAAETSATTREAMRQLDKAPPPTSEDVQGVMAKPFMAAIALIVFFGGAICARLAGRFAIRAREEYVATRSQIKAGANVLTQSIGDDSTPLPTPKPKPRPEPVLPPYPPEPRLKLGQAGRIGTKKSGTAPAPDPVPAPSIDADEGSEPGRNRVGTSPEPEPADVPRETGDPEAIPEPAQPKNRSRLEPGGRLVIGDPVLVHRKAEPVLRALILSDITEVSYSTANDVLKSTGVRPAGMGKPALLAALAHLEACELLTPAGPGGRRAPSSGLIVARQSGAHIDDIVGVMLGRHP